MKIQGKSSVEAVLEIQSTPSQVAPVFLITDSCGNFVFEIYTNPVKIQYHEEDKKNKYKVCCKTLKANDNITKVFVASIMAMVSLTPKFKKTLDEKTIDKILALLTEAITILK